MGQSGKKRKQRRRPQRRECAKPEPPDQEVLDSIGSPNAWTPKIEDDWLNELRKISVGEIYCRFPPLRKPTNVGKRNRGSGWSDNA